MGADQARAEEQPARVGRELDGVDGRGDPVADELERVLRARAAARRGVRVVLRPAATGPFLIYVPRDAHLSFF